MEQRVRFHLCPDSTEEVAEMKANNDIEELMKKVI